MQKFLVLTKTTRGVYLFAKQDLEPVTVVFCVVSSRKTSEAGVTFPNTKSGYKVEIPIVSRVAGFPLSTKRSGSTDQ